MQIINGLSGSGKTQKLVDDIISISEKNVLILTLNQNKKEYLNNLLKQQNIVAYSFNEFISDLLKKCPQNFNYKILSDFLASKIIYSIIKTEFLNNKSLNNLLKSNSFQRELYNIFGIFKTTRISSETLPKIIENTDINNENKARLQIISKVYKKYNNFLQEHKLLDFRDMILNCIDFLNQNEILKKTFQNKYKYVFVLGAENLTSIQLELLKIFTPEENIFLYGDFNAKIHSYMGANIFKKSDYDLNKTFRNEDILKRALYIVNNKDFDFSTSESVKYQIFNNSEEELSFIAKDILNNVKNKKFNYNDFAILTRDNSKKQEIVNILKKFNIPVAGEIYSEEYQIFKYNFTNLINIFEILKKLNIKHSILDGLKNIEYFSKVDLENMANELNSIIKILLSDVIQNKYSLENIETLHNNSIELFLTNTILKNSDIFNKDDKRNIKVFFDKFHKMYDLFLKNNFIDIVIELTDIINIKNDDYKKFLAKFISKIQELCEIKSILKEEIQPDEIFELLNIASEEDILSQDSVNLLTFFQSQGLEFKKVYIPLLIENYFPKKTRNVLFISKNANDKFSQKIKEIYPDFYTLIPFGKDELQEEKNLLYVAMSRATEQIFISTHKYEDKKQCIPSVFFEILSFIDAKNLVVSKNQEIPPQKTEEVKNEIIEEIIKKDEPIISYDDELFLSASAISDFIKCPQQFYFARLLNLKGENNYSTSYGSFIHLIFELFLTKYIKDFSKEMILDLGLSFLNSNKNPEKALDMGFQKEDIEKLSLCTILNIEEMKKDFCEAIDILDNSGYFNEKPIKAVCEKDFGFTLDTCPNIIFTGYIDALVEYETGYKIVDYKTGHTKKELSQILPKMSEEFFDKDGNLLENFSEKKLKEFEYQIPIYYFACKNAPKLKQYSNIEKMGYQYVQNKKISQGITEDFINKEEIFKYEEKIIKNLKCLIIDNMYNKTKFEAKSDNYNCQHCDFSNLCDKNINGENDVE